MSLWANSLTYVRQHRQAFIIGGGVFIALCVIGGAVAGYYHQQSNTSDTCVTGGARCPVATTSSPTITTASPSPTPSLLPSRLTGALVAPGTEALRPLAVMIENHPDARPQSGLSSAGLVYEAIAEGGITRFMAVFDNAQTPVKVGPIRSARTYYVDFATELGAMYAHVGGNMDALDQIKATGVLDLDQFSLGEPTYHRETTRNVALEHTMYSSTEKLWQAGTDSRHYSPQADYTGWKFADDAPADKRPASETVAINFSSAEFAVSWTYDPATNTYTRSMAGKPHIDANGNTAITAKNIIIETVKNTPTVTRINEKGWIYTLTGTGNGVVITNGVATPVTWKKSGTERTRYFTSDGAEVTLTRGTTWVEITHADTKVSY